MQNDNLKSYLHLHLIVFIWGFTAILGELISLDALPLVWFRMLMAVGFIVLFMLYKKTDITIPRKTIMVFLLLGLVIALHWLTFFKAIKVSNVSVTLACLSTGAFFASFLEPILYKRKVIWYEVFFGLLVVVGLYIIFNFEGDYYLGIILALTSAFLSALFSVMNGKYAKMYDSTVISFYELSGGVLCFSIYLLLTNSFSKELFNKIPELQKGKYHLLTEYGRFVYQNAAFAASIIEIVKDQIDKELILCHFGGQAFVREIYTNDKYQGEITVLQQQKNSKVKNYAIAGPLCYGGDFLVNQIHLPEVQENDWIIAPNVGGNSLGLFSKHCSQAFPKVLAYQIVKNQIQISILKQKEQSQDVIYFWE